MWNSWTDCLPGRGGRNPWLMGAGIISGWQSLVLARRATELDVSPQVLLLMLEGPEPSWAELQSMCWTAHSSQGWLSIMPRSLSNTDSQSLYYYYNTLISNQNTKRFDSHPVLLTQQSRPAPPMSQSNNNSYFYHLSKLSAILNTESHKL